MTTHISPPYGDKSLNKIIEEAIKNNWERLALSDMDGASYKFSEVAENVEKLHSIFAAANMKPGHKVAICGKNSCRMGNYIHSLPYIRGCGCAHPS